MMNFFSRGLMNLYHAFAILWSNEYDLQEYHKNCMKKKTSAYFLKFLQAFTASAPQLVVRMHKLISQDSHPFSNICKCTTSFCVILLSIY